VNKTPFHIPKYYDPDNMITKILRVQFQYRAAKEKYYLRLKRASDFQRGYGETMVDNVLYTCPKCGLVFEPPSIYNGREYYYYKHIPSIGKRRRVCGKCFK
jgi:hypothetical protein